jgi:hypothetical protein
MIKISTASKSNELTRHFLGGTQAAEEYLELIEFLGNTIGISLT